MHTREAEKPIGTFRCVGCEEIWDGSELYDDPRSIGKHMTCGNSFCGANVQKISDFPKSEYERQKI